MYANTAIAKAMANSKLFPVAVKAMAAFLSYDSFVCLLMKKLTKNIAHGNKNPKGKKAV
jgi:hypothetical protein